MAGYGIVICTCLVRDLCIVLYSVNQIGTEVQQGSVDQRRSLPADSEPSWTRHHYRALFLFPQVTTHLGWQMAGAIESSRVDARTNFFVHFYTLVVVVALVIGSYVITPLVWIVAYLSFNKVCTAIYGAKTMSRPLVVLSCRVFSLGMSDWESPRVQIEMHQPYIVGAKGIELSIVCTHH